jgi:ADP-heptose:LPS heptosyltransferase
MINSWFPRCWRRCNAVLGISKAPAGYSRYADPDIFPRFGGDALDPPPYANRENRAADAGAADAAPRENVERIVIYRMGSLGDTVVALPCFHKLAEAFPDAERYVLTNIPVSSKAAALELILGPSGLIHGVINYPIRLRSIREMWRLMRRLRAMRATKLIYLGPSRGLFALYRDVLFFRLSGFPRIIGAPFARHLRDYPYDAAKGPVEYECSRLIRAVAALGPIDLDDRKNWDLRLTDAERKAGDQALRLFGGKPFVAINMGGKVAENHWGQDNWRHLLRALSVSHGGYGLLFLGAAEEAGAVAGVVAGWPGPVVNACGTLLPRESAAALLRASLFVGHDSGPMHLAAAVGVACVAPFGGYNPPRRWHPYGARHRVVHRMQGVQHVTVEEIVALVRDTLPPGAMKQTMLEL